MSPLMIWLKGLLVLLVFAWLVSCLIVFIVYLGRAETVAGRCDKKLDKTTSATGGY